MLQQLTHMAPTSNNRFGNLTLSCSLMYCVLRKVYRYEHMRAESPGVEVVQALTKE